MKSIVDEDTRSLTREGQDICTEFSRLIEDFLHEKVVKEDINQFELRAALTTQLGYMIAMSSCGLRINPQIDHE